MTDEDIRSVESLFDATAPKLGVFEQVRKAFESSVVRDRSAIAKRIVWLYVSVIGATAAYLISFGLIKQLNEFGNLSELVKIAVLPVITLVLGYYFGSHRPE